LLVGSTRKWNSWLLIKIIIIRKVSTVLRNKTLKVFYAMMSGINFGLGAALETVIWYLLRLTASSFMPSGPKSEIAGDKEIFSFSALPSWLDAIKSPVGVQMRHRLYLTMSKLFTPPLCFPIVLTPLLERLHNPGVLAHKILLFADIMTMQALAQRGGANQWMRRER
jgi:hypothetical protein